MSDQGLNLKFVGEVEKHEELYNYKLSGYSRKEVTEKAWQEVAAQVNLSVPECKDKWRNLRTVFMRKMKPPLSGDRKKKAYYLENAMQFCLPYIKTSTPPSSRSLPPVLLNSTGDDEVIENEETYEDSASQVDFLHASNTQPSSSNSPTFSTYQHSISQLSQAKKNLTMKNKPAVDVDQFVAEYFKAKKLRLEANEVENNSQRINRQQGLKMFLLSLIPELEELSDSQIKLFKRRVFCIIDEISI